MAEALTIPLGYAPATGNDSVTQTNFFKAILRSKIGRDPDGAYLKTTADNRRRGMAVEYDPDVQGAQDWAFKAREHAEWAWDQVTRGRRPEVRVIARSRGMKPAPAALLMAVLLSVQVGAVVAVAEWYRRKDEKPGRTMAL